MIKFTDSNTEGFSQADLDTLNDAYVAILGGDEDDEDHVADRLNNLWTEGADADELVRRYRERFPRG